MPKEDNPQRPSPEEICRFFTNTGWCKYGETCKHSHVLAEPWLIQLIDFGTQLCWSCVTCAGWGGRLRIDSCIPLLSHSPCLSLLSLSFVCFPLHPCCFLRFPRFSFVSAVPCFSLLFLAVPAFPRFPLLSLCFPFAFLLRPCCHNSGQTLCYLAGCACAGCCVCKLAFLCSFAGSVNCSLPLYVPPKVRKTPSLRKPPIPLVFACLQSFTGPKWKPQTYIAEQKSEISFVGHCACQCVLFVYLCRRHLILCCVCPQTCSFWVFILLLLISMFVCGTPTRQTGQREWLSLARHEHNCQQIVTARLK